MVDNHWEVMLCRAKRFGGMAADAAVECVKSQGGTDAVNS
jgi:hypothetical protein